MSKPAIIVDDVSKYFRLYRERAGSLKEMLTNRNFGRYEEFWALRNVSMTVERGSVFGLVGHNGSGKSSLLRLIAGIQRPTSGTITTNGRISALLELGAGFHPDLSGRENIYLNAAILGITRRETDQMIDGIIEFSGLEAFIDSPVRHYSSGMYVRLGFAVAVHVNPQILIIDEVIAVGDEEFQRRCFEHLHKLRNEGVTILLVTHGLELVRTMCDHALWLEHGQVRGHGTAAEVVSDYLNEVNEAEATRLRQADARAAELAAAARSDVDGTAAPAGAVDGGDGSGGADGGGATADGGIGGVRTGTAPPVTLGKLEATDPSGNAVSAVRSRDAIVFRINYTATEAVEEPVFSLAFENEAGVEVARPATPSGAMGTGGAVAAGPGVVEYRIDSLPLAPGRYRLSVEVQSHDRAVVFDRHPYVSVLQVQPADVPVFGLVDLPGQWASDTTSP